MSTQITEEQNKAKILIENVRKNDEGEFLPFSFRTFNGSDVADFLTRLGYEVVDNIEVRGNGLAWTMCGIYVSTNGYVSYASPN